MLGRNFWIQFDLFERQATGESLPLAVISVFRPRGQIVSRRVRRIVPSGLFLIFRWSIRADFRSAHMLDFFDVRFFLSNHPISHSPFHLKTL
ncbi:hypothetical protein LptCag_0595 [Leptospirillum ferriphilum]|uniref:Uncharacterized protein n=1 Tax=Leptospirillum ferriphilum TaxID=178606 RepID=A0A094X606_9BACT|nr:hypothetical protein LptCag_0595 [Leptospirillum ferriphilum]